MKLVIENSKPLNRVEIFQAPNLPDLLATTRIRNGKTGAADL